MIKRFIIIIFIILNIADINKTHSDINIKIITAIYKIQTTILSIAEIKIIKWNYKNIAFNDNEENIIYNNKKNIMNINILKIILKKKLQ